jgi:hypothetical protein
VVASGSPVRVTLSVSAAGYKTIVRRAEVVRFSWMTCVRLVGLIQW